MRWVLGVLMVWLTLGVTPAFADSVAIEDEGRWTGSSLALPRNDVLDTAAGDSVKAAGGGGLEVTVKSHWTFETTVLLSALAGIVGMFWLNGLPKPYHPVFDAPDFEQATSSRFFLCIESDDPQFDRVNTRQFMETLGAAHVSEVELKK